MIRIIDAIAECDDGITTERNRSKIKRIVVHRVGKDMKYGINLGDTAWEISDHFTGKNDQYPEVKKATGGENAYTLMIGGDCGDSQWDGVAWQILHPDDVGHHARRWWNVTALGIACIGDFRIKAVSPKQYEALVAVCAELCPLLGIDPLGYDDRKVPYLAGHDQLPGGSSDPNKECPGMYLPMDRVRADVSMVIKSGAGERLRDLGMRV
jgi:hypothetical protein